MDEFIGDRQVWHRQGLGPLASVTVAGPVANGQRSRARDLGLELEPVSLQQLVIRTTGVHQEEVGA